MSWRKANNNFPYGGPGGGKNAKSSFELLSGAHADPMYDSISSIMYMIYTDPSTLRE